MCQKQFLNLLVLHFLSLIVITNPDGGYTGLLQTVVAAAVCFVSRYNTVDDGYYEDGMVAAVGGALQTPDGTELRILPCLCY